MWNWRMGTPQGRFGKYRVPDCVCETNFTCGPCLKGRPPYFFTPTPLLKQGSPP